MTIILPHFEYESPLLVGADGFRYVPLFVLCSLLGLDATRELRRARNKLLWSSARLHLIEWSGGEYFAWCLPYPLGIAYWLGGVERQCIPNLERRAQLERTVHEGTELGGRAWQLVSDRFEQGRRRMYALSNGMTEASEALR